MVNIKRILCPVDLSQFSRDALHHALALARWCEAQVTVFHVYSAPRPVVPVTGMPGNVPPPPLVQPGDVTEEVRRFCAPSLRQSGQSVDIVVSEGSPVKRSLSTLDEEVLGWAA
jgi:nucleotide-binding universal stress UspA family protein